MVEFLDIFPITLSCFPRSAQANLIYGRAKMHTGIEYSDWKGPRLAAIDRVLWHHS